MPFFILIILMLILLIITKLNKPKKSKSKNKSNYSKNNNQCYKLNCNQEHNQNYNPNYNQGYNQNYNPNYNQEYNQNYNSNYNEIKIYPYKKKYILTAHEYYFYKDLTKIAEKYNLIIWTKVRVADIVEVDTQQTNEYMKYFGKIKAKHIDFILANKESLHIVALLELDDNSHTPEKDEFKNMLCQVVQYPLIRCRNINTVENQLRCIMNINNLI